MTLQERQKREIEALKEEIKESGVFLHIWSMEKVDAYIDQLNESLRLVTEDPEKYFKNIDEEE